MADQPPDSHSGKLPEDSEAPNSARRDRDPVDAREHAQSTTGERDQPTVVMTPSAGGGIVYAPAGRLATGEVVAGRYRIVSVLGEGGMGVVYRAADLDLHEPVALKTLHAAATIDERAMSRFRREVQLARRVTHRNVCRIFDFGQHVAPSGQHLAFVTMELIEGSTLAHAIGMRGRIDPAEAEIIVRQLCAGLDAAHEAGVIHRDFKSANVMIARREESSELRAVITDFGLARLSDADGSDLTRSREEAIVGTPAYMAPEQIDGSAITPATDIYALGVVMFEMLTGELPFSGTDIGSLVRRLQQAPPNPRLRLPELDRTWEQVILRCLQRESRDRFASAGDVARALRGEVVSKPPRRRTAAIVAAVTVAAALAGGLFLFSRRAVAPAETPRAAVAPVRAVATPRHSVAVLGFRDLSRRSDTAWLATALTEMLTNELASTEKIRTVPSEEVTRLKTDLELRDVDSHSRATLARIHAAVAADSVVLGSYTAIGPSGAAQIRVDVRVQRAGDGETIAAFHHTGSEATLFELVSRAGVELRARLGAPSVAPASDPSVHISAEATRHYAEGVRRLREFDALAAKEALERAVVAQPDFPLAHVELAEALAILGYDTLAAEAARKAFQLSGALPRSERLAIEAKYRQRSRDLDRAIALYRQLIDLFPDEPQHRVNLITVYIDNARSDEALAALADVRRSASSVAREPRIDLLESWTHEITANYAGVLSAADRAIAGARALGSRSIVAEALTMRGTALAYLGREKDALDAFNEAEELFVEIGNRAGIAKGLRKRGFIYWRQGKIDEVVKVTNRALRIYRDIGQEQGIASATGVLGLLKNQQGDYSGARTLFETALITYKRIGDRQNVSWALASIAGTFAEQGDDDAAIAQYERSLVLAREIGEKSQEAFDLANLGMIHADIGNIDHAERNCSQAAALLRSLGDVSSARSAEAVLANVAMYRGNIAAARAMHERSLAERQKAGEATGVAESQLALARLAFYDGRHADAVKLADAAAAQFQTSEQIDDQLFATMVVANAEAAAGRATQAAAALASARALLRKAQGPESQLLFDLSAARVAAASPHNGASVRRELERIAARAETLRAMPAMLDARLLAADVARHNGDVAAARAGLLHLRTAAAAKGFGLWAGLADARLRLL